jgi:hypothetical protein
MPDEIQWFTCTFLSFDRKDKQSGRIDGHKCRAGEGSESTFKRGESLVLRGKGKGIMNAAMALLEN